MSSHEQRVARIAQQVRARAGAGRPASLGKAAVSHMVPNPNDPRHRDQKIDIRDLRDILSIDVGGPDGQTGDPGPTCTAESGVTFCDLVAATLPRGYLPALVPELKTITLGGAVSGCSVESMSFRYGGFHDTCLSYEVVTGTGEVLEVSRDRDPAIFEALHGSYGTLGILTKLTFRLVPARPYVQIEYRCLPDAARFHAALLAACASGEADFIDAIVHGPDAFVLCLGRFVDTAPWLSDYSYLSIYYKSTRALRLDYLRTEDYLFRYDAECHWLTRTLPLMETLPARLLLGKLLLGSTNLLRWSERLRPVLRYQRRPPVVVDVFIPQSRFAEFYDWYARTLNYFPLWIVPYRLPRPYPWIADGHAARISDTLFLDCAIYGKANDEVGVDYSQLLEQKTYELGGVKTLISANHHDEATFWSIYSRERYQAAKRRTDPHNLFRDLYEKFHWKG